METNRDGVAEAVKEVFDEYLPRFKRILWDTRFLARVVMKIDVPKFFAGVEDKDVREAYFESIERLTKTGEEGYDIFKFSLTFYWAEVESFIDAFLKSWITHARPPTTVDVFEKIKLDKSVGELERLSRSELMGLYVQSLKSHKTVRKSSEIRTFFAAMKEIGLGECDGEKEKRLGDTFTELQQIRNVMVHRSGIVDARMVKACPWLGTRSDVEVGKLYPLNIEVVQNYGKRIFDLTDHILDRLDKHASDEKHT